MEQVPSVIEGYAWTTGRKWILGVSGAVGMLLLFCDWTDYSLAGTWADYLLAVVALIGSLVVLRISRYIPHADLCRRARVFALVILVEAGLPILLTLIMTALSPLGMLLVAAYVVGEEQVASVVSPDGSRVAEEYFRSGGLLGNESVVVRVKYRWLPLLERDLYQGAPDAAEHIKWEDNDTLYIPDTNWRMAVGVIRPEIAPPVQVSVLTVGFLGAVTHAKTATEESEGLAAAMAKPLHDLPLYPGGTQNDYAGADPTSGGGFRAFDVQAPGADDAANWYKQALAQTPWRVVSARRYDTVDRIAASPNLMRLVYNCIDSVKQAGDGTETHYYWRFLWNEQSPTTRVIAETPNLPTVDDCKYGR